MFSLLVKRNPCSTLILSIFKSRFFSSNQAAQNPLLETHRFVVADYLVATLGFSSVKAASLSRTIAHLKSPENPDSVIDFLKQQGFSDADIKTLVTGHPRLLSSSPQRTLHPNLTALRNMGLSAAALNKIILSSPYALLLPSAVSRITFWKDFLDGDEPALVNAFTRNWALVGSDISQNISPKISLLQRYGFSIKDIRRIMCTSCRFITSKVSGMEDLLERTKELGFQPGSRMFSLALHAMTAITREAFQKKMDFFKSSGWSEDDFLSAFRKSPQGFALSEENLKVKMDFLLGEAMCESSYIASVPYLLGYSLEKRMRPRLHVLRLLEIKGLSTKSQDFYSAIQPIDDLFVARFIRPHMEKIPGLHQAYLATRAAVPEKREH